MALFKMSQCFHRNPFCFSVLIILTLIGFLFCFFQLFGDFVWVKSSLSYLASTFPMTTQMNLLLIVLILLILLISILFFRFLLSKNKKPNKALLFIIKFFLFILASQLRFVLYDQVLVGSAFILWVSGDANWGGISANTSQPPALEYSSGTGAPESTSSSGWTEIWEEAQDMSSADALQNIRVAHASDEERLFLRIRELQNMSVHRLPPQLENGEYERLVRDNLNSSFSVPSYQDTLALELSDMRIMEYKAHLQNALVHLFIHEDVGRIQSILSQSPFGETQLREAAFSFFEDRGEAFPTNSRPQRIFYEAQLQVWLGDLTRRGYGSLLYRSFLQYFLNGGG